jgi:hypothetical protein
LRGTVSDNSSRALRPLHGLTGAIFNRPSDFSSNPIASKKTFCHL